MFRTSDAGKHSGGLEHRYAESKGGNRQMHAGADNARRSLYQFRYEQRMRPTRQPSDVRQLLEENRVVVAKRRADRQGHQLIVPENRSMHMNQSNKGVEAG